jgi:hypothetical protein
MALTGCLHPFTRAFSDRPGADRRDRGTRLRDDPISGMATQSLGLIAALAAVAGHFGAVLVWGADFLRLQ